MDEEHGRRAKANRRWIMAAMLLLLLALVAASAWGVRRALGYTFLYGRSRFNPASVVSGAPTYFYIDWRDDLRSPAKLRDLAVSWREESASPVPREPLPVIQAALALHDLILDEPTQEREAIFRALVDWVAEDGVQYVADGIPVWPQRQTFARYGLRGQWVSALTQGQAISLLVRAAARTGEARYAELARGAARAFRDERVPIVWRDAAGGAFFEEYPCDPPSHVMNGCLLAWLGLWDLARYDGDADLRGYCEEALRSFQPIIRQHDLGRWTRYDVLQTRPTSPAYHELHAALAETMAAITNEPFWVMRAIRWHETARRPEERMRVFIAVLSHKIAGIVSGPRVRPVGIGLDFASIQAAQPESVPAACSESVRAAQ